MKEPPRGTLTQGQQVSSLVESFGHLGRKDKNQKQKKKKRRDWEGRGSEDEGPSWWVYTSLDEGTRIESEWNLPWVWFRLVRSNFEELLKKF